MDQKDIEMNEIGKNRNKSLKSAVSNNKAYLIGIGGLLVVAAIIVAAGTVLIKRNTKFEDETFQRLPNYIKPIEYSVQIHVFFQNYTFHTVVNTTLQVLKPTQYIVLNADKLENLSASLTSGLIQNDMPISRPRFDVIRLTTLTELKEGNYTLMMECDGFITDDLVGLYRSQYAIKDTMYPYLLTTKMESSYARRVFPCWDEPIFKAQFKLTLIGPFHQQYVSNMPIQKQSGYGDDELMVTFHKTPPMSTYLLAFVIGELSIISDVDSLGIVQRVIVPKGSVGNGSFALETSMRSLEFLSIYFKRLYPLPKLDLLAVRDFQSGAMEHWGLVTYRESRLLPNEDSPFESQVAVVTTICHENAHMWFGDLVTMSWWSQLWLNEGFATWIEALCTNYLHPDYEIWNRFLVEDMKTAMVLDSQVTTHAVIVDVPNTDDVRVIYNAISYRKGASILRMLDIYVGSAVFQTALRNYIAAYAYGNTVTRQLWDEVSAVSGSNISDLMDAWTSRPGFPYVKVTNIKRGPDSLNVTLEQGRFFADGNSVDPYNTIWQIPISVCSNTNPLGKEWSIILDSKSDTFTLVGAQFKLWLKFNVNKSSFIIFMYTDEMLDTLQVPVKEKTLSSLDRFDIESDLYMLASAGHVNMSRYLEFCPLYSDDNDLSIWTDIVSNINTLGGLVEYMSENVTIQQYGQNLFGSLYGRLGLDLDPDDFPTLSALRILAYEAAGIYGDKSALLYARNNFTKALISSNFPVDLREPTFIINAIFDGTAAYNKLKEFYLNAISSDDQRLALVAMGYTQETECMQDIFNMIVETGQIRLQDIFYPLRQIGGTRKGRDYAWQYTKNNIAKIKEVLTPDYLVENYINPLFVKFGTTDVIPEMEQLFTANNISLNNTIIVQLFDKIKINAAIVERSKEDVIDFLANIPQPINVQ